MPNKSLLEKYARLAVQIGVNVQKNQPVVIRATTETREFVRLLAKEAYLASSEKVHVQWGDDYVNRLGLEHRTVESLENIPGWVVDQAQHFIDENACFISVTSPIPGLNSGIDPTKMQRAGLATMKKLSFVSDYMMGNKTQWNVIAAPNQVWAEKVFPNLQGDDAVEALWAAIFKACRVEEDNDPVAEWEAHNERLRHHNEVLNTHQFASLSFTNTLGTNIEIGLVDNHVWAGGSEMTTKGTRFNPNIPTEETFTMPHKMKVNGKVVATKPLNYQGNLIEDFWLEFKNGKVIAYDAKKEKATLKNLIEFDEGSAYLGEIALLSHDSPISNANILFLNTLFDENASCHMALGRAYPMNVKGGTEMKPETLKELGYNHSMAHSDFMFGSKDLTVVGTKKDGTKITIFDNGNFVI